MQTVKLVAPAKVNLFLGIGAPREDGYHAATSVMHALALHDRLDMTLVETGEDVTLFEPGDPAQPLRQIHVKVEEGAGLVVGAQVVWSAGLEATQIADEDNLACKAVHRLAAKVGRCEDETMRIVIQKKIPHQTGLGGGSADAAAALVGAASLWGLAPGDDRVEEVARELGADVAFFLHGGCAVLEGTGDEYVRSLQPSKSTVVIIKPVGGVSTAAAYAKFDELAPEVPSELLQRVQGALTASDIPLFNNLAVASECLHSELAAVREFAAGQPGIEGVLLCGSGAGTFAVCENYEAGQVLSAGAQARGWWARCTSFTSLSASILP